MVKKNQIKLDKKDFYRALLTDTFPSDVPIIFSNDGFYINTHRITFGRSNDIDRLLKSIFDQFLTPSDPSIRFKWSKPYKYKIRKNEVSLRTLSLIHPRAQINWVDFYKENGKFITYNGSLSSISIRAPHKIANSFYYPGSFDKNNKYKEINIETLEDEIFRKHAGSYFTYKGVDRIYKLFSSSRYFDLEKQFSYMSLVDVSNCFDSIYTHSVSWAIKNKEYIKGVVRWGNQACQQLDTLMQRSNNNETNGIPIGSEVSRIFAELIFQKVDLNIIDDLFDKHHFKQGVDYEILRYVDDFIVFTKNENDKKIVTQTISDKLNEYNLYVNEGKLQEYKRPFHTNKSSIVHNLYSIIESLENTLFSKNDNSTDYNYQIIPKKIGNANNVVMHFINSVKDSCKNSKEGYGDVASYLISTFSKRLIKLQETEIEFQKKNHKPSEHINNLHKVISILFEIMFFLYTVNSTVVSSNKLAKTIIIIDGFYRKYHIKKQAYFRSLIMKNFSQLSSRSHESTHRDGFLSLERLNILLATCDFGKSYLLPAEYFEDILHKKTPKISYFNFICLIYYFKNHKQYEKFITQIEAICLDQFTKEKNLLLEDSEQLHLFLDLLCCPFVSTKFRCELLSLIDASLNNEAKERLVSKLEKIYWFVKWDGLNLVSLLERKELNSAY